ncbi:hypothetical protein ACRZ5S_18170 [Vibrio scophthalmi]|uniref:hypothetical protein n=1 Tax=Vibrio scophthalmi TaxID=45658 RepID=UPI003EB81E4F
MVLADKFFSYWCDVVEERNDDIERAWCDNKAYSHLIIHSQKSIVKGVAEKLDLNCYNGDYYYIDSVFYDNDDYIKDFPEQCFLTGIRIAFEHENSFKSGLFQEVAHLLLINCDLKVVVSYPPDEISESQELDYLHGIISASKVAEEISNNKSFLFIMGHAVPYKWVAWQYNKSGWIKIANKAFKTDSQRLAISV